MTHTDNLFSDTVKNHFYTECTGREPKQKGRVNQVFNSSIQRILYFLSINEKHFKFFHSTTLTKLLTADKYREIIDTLKHFNIIKVRDDYCPNAMFHNKAGYTKSYRITDRGQKMMKNVSINLSPSDIEAIEKAFTWERDYEKENQALQYTKRTTKKVKMNVSIANIEQFVEDNLRKIQKKKGWDEIAYEMKKKEALSVIQNHHRHVYFSRSYYNRIHNSLGRLPKIFRKLFTHKGEKFAGADLSNIQPFFVFDTYHNYCRENNIDMSLKNHQLGKIIADGKFYELIQEMIEKHYGKKVSREAVKMPTLKMINRNYQFQLAKDAKVQRMVEHVVAEEYSEFFDFILQLNSYTKLKETHIARVAYDITSAKENRATSFRYAEWETHFMSQVLQRIEYQLGDIALYTTYDCVNVPVSYIKQVQQIMMEVSKQMHYRQASISIEGVESEERAEELICDPSCTDGNAFYYRIRKQIEATREKSSLTYSDIIQEMEVEQQITLHQEMEADHQIAV